MAEKSIIILSIILGISIFINLSCVFFIVYNETEWENEYNSLNTEWYNLNIQWCEINNDYIDIINDMIIELQNYDNTYNEIDLFEENDCWE